MENPEIPTIIANNLFDFKDSYIWSFLTSNALKYLLGSLVILASFYWSLFLVINIQLIKPLYDIIFDKKGGHAQKKPHSIRVMTTQNIKTKIMLQKILPFLFLSVIVCIVPIQLQADFSRKVETKNTTTFKNPIYVKPNMQGNQDGTSWSNAYHTLHDALENYKENDEIWVAAGTYFPQNPSRWRDDVKRTFYIYQDVAIYGGFNGTEVSRDERDPAANITILSGDINEDDIADDFDNNKEDNVINVVFIEEEITTTTRMDGFTIRGGYADIDDVFFTNKRGAGIFSFGAAQINNCQFIQNYAIWHAAGIYYYRANAEGGIVTNCLFQNNKSLGFGAGITVSEVLGQGVLVESCQFVNNQAERGGGYYVFNATGMLKSCSFTNNQSTGIGGGAFTFYRSGTEQKTVITNCVFDNNVSSNGGAFGFRSDGGQNNLVNIYASIFTNNQSRQLATDAFPDGGAISIEYSNGNPNNNQVLINDCLIENNTSEGDAAGIFVANFAGTDNHLEVNNSRIFNNIAQRQVGGMWIIESGNITTSANILNTHFKGNAAPIAPGFALSYFSNTPPPTSRKVELVNCLFSEHNTNDTLSAVIGTLNSELTLTNCTVANNATPSIGILTQAPTLVGTINLQNTILQNKDFPNISFGELSIDGQVVGAFVSGNIQSLGGNLISDNSLDSFLLSTDQSAVNPLLETGTFQLSENSPAIDAGVLPENPNATDLTGNDRVQGGCIDIGALESSFDSGTNCLMTTSTQAPIIAATNDLLLYPNPVTNWLNLSIDNDWQGGLNIHMVNMLGQVVYRTQLEKRQGTTTFELELTELPKGVYQLLVDNGQEVMVKDFVKL